MVRFGFAATRLKKATATELTMNSFVDQSILEFNMRPSVWQLKLGAKWITTQQDLKNTAAEQLKKISQDVAMTQTEMCAFHPKKTKKSHLSKTSNFE